MSFTSEYAVIDHGDLDLTGEWAYVFKLNRPWGNSNMPRLTLENIYELEHRYGNNVQVTSLYFLPVWVYFSSKQLATEAKLRYLS
jgi:hypothetical protein